MKRSRIVTTMAGLCLAAAVFAGCSSQETSGQTAEAVKISGGQTQIAVENTAADSGAVSGGYKFSYKGYDVVPGAPAGPVLDAFGDPEDVFQGASCAGQGMSTVYTYPEFLIYTYEENGAELIEGVEIENPLIDCDGIHTGDKPDAAKAVFGTPSQEDVYGMLFVSGDTAVQITTDGADKIQTIVYRRMVN